MEAKKDRVRRYLKATSWARYLTPVAGAFLATALSLLTKIALPHSSKFPYEFYFLIVIFAVAWYAGYAAGVLGCAITMIAFPLAFDPKFHFASLDWTRFILLSAVSAGISAVSAGQQRRAARLERMNEELDLRVRERTAELEKSVAALRDEIADHQKTATKLKTQVERLNLLDQITRAIGERQDLRSVYQVVIRTLEENLPIDFGCICLYSPDAEELTVEWVGVKSDALAMDLALTVQSRIPIDQNGLSRCVSGQLVHEPDITHVDFPFPRRLVKGGLHSFVGAPLLSEARVFGVLIAARFEANAFTSSDCEFLRQLSEHIALAAHQAHIYDALQNAYDDLRQTQQAIMQQERLRALGQMASGIAHDINNALSPIALYTDSLLDREPNLSERTRDYLETARRAIQDITQTVARMREFSRQREPQWALMPVEMNAVVPQVVDLTRARWSDIPQQRGVVIQVRTDLMLNLPAIAGIESEIREALTNLIFNAVDAMPDGGTLTLRTGLVSEGYWAAAKKTVCVEVQDTGVGMDEETSRRCQEPFFTTKGERGTGLGLAMVYGAMQRHNAELHIESKVGTGTTMSLRFPVPAVMVSHTAAGGYKQAMPPQLRILIIDDDPLVVKSLRDTLERDRHTVRSATGGREGIEVFQSAQKSDQPFAVVITDLGMPYDGRKVAAAIKETSPKTPVILLTGWGQRLVDDGGMPPHVDRVLNKPPKLHQLRDALAELMSAGDQAMETSA